MEGRPKPICPLNFSQVGGIKSFCGEISQYSKNCSSYFLTVTVSQCNVCISTNILSSKRDSTDTFYRMCIHMLTVGTLIKNALM